MNQIIMLILNLVVFALCIWVRFDLDFRRWVWDMDWYTFWYCTYVNMVASIFAAASCICGLYGLFYVSIDNFVFCEQDDFHVLYATSK